MNTLRRYYGLRWQGALPSRRDLHSTMTTAAGVAFFVATFAIAGSLDYAAEQAAEAERQTAIAERQTAAAERATYALAECLNGQARFVAADGKSATLCLRAREVTN